MLELITGSLVAKAVAGWVAGMAADVAKDKFDDWNESRQQRKDKRAVDALDAMIERAAERKRKPKPKA